MSKEAMVLRVTEADDGYNIVFKIDDIEAIDAIEILSKACSDILEEIGVDKEEFLTDLLSVEAAGIQGKVH